MRLAPATHSGSFGRPVDANPRSQDSRACCAQLYQRPKTRCTLAPCALGHFRGVVSARTHLFRGLYSPVLVTFQGPGVHNMGFILMVRREALSWQQLISLSESIPLWVKLRGLCLKSVKLCRETLSQVLRSSDPYSLEPRSLARFRCFGLQQLPVPAPPGRSPEKRDWVRTLD